MTVSGNHAAPTSARVILLPGLGADGRMFDPQRTAFPHLETPSWIAHRETESLPDYALRMVDTLNADKPFYLGGASFGSMVALEMARHLRPQAVFLIGGCRSGQQVPWYLKYWEPAGRVIPDAMVDLVRRLPVRVWANLMQAEPRHAGLFCDMMTNVPIPFLRWGHRAILRWEGVADLAMPVHQIHGGIDRILPVRRVKPDTVVGGAGHLLNLTHPEAGNAFIRDRVF